MEASEAEEAASARDCSSGVRGVAEAVGSAVAVGSPCSGCSSPSAVGVAVARGIELLLLFVTESVATLWGRGKLRHQSQACRKH